MPTIPSFVVSMVLSATIEDVLGVISSNLSTIHNYIRGKIKEKGVDNLLRLMITECQYFIGYRPASIRSKSGSFRWMKDYYERKFYQNGSRPPYFFLYNICLENLSLVMLYLELYNVSYTPQELLFINTRAKWAVFFRRRCPGLLNDIGIVNWLPRWSVYH